MLALLIRNNLFVHKVPTRVVVLRPRSHHPGSGSSVSVGGHQEHVDVVFWLRHVVSPDSLTDLVVNKMFFEKDFVQRTAITSIRNSCFPTADA